MTEKEQHEAWDLLLLDLEHRAEQVRQLKRYEPRRLVIQAVTAAGVLFGVGAAVGALLAWGWFGPGPPPPVR